MTLDVKFDTGAAFDVAFGADCDFRAEMGQVMQVAATPRLSWGIHCHTEELRRNGAADGGEAHGQKRHGKENPTIRSFKRCGRINTDYGGRILWPISTSTRSSSARK